MFIVKIENFRSGHEVDHEIDFRCKNPELF
jgi:hypothetical protein